MGLFFFIKKKNHILIKLFFIFLLLVNIINLPTMNIKNTSYIHYSNNSISSLQFQEVNNDARYLHPINSHKFHQFIFNIKYANSLIRNYESFSFMNKEIKIENIYPSLGILRLKFLFTKLYKNNNNDLENIAIPEIILNFKSINFTIIILNIFLSIFLILYFFINIKFLLNIVKRK